MRKRTAVYLDSDLVRLARIWAARTGRKDYEVVGEALRLYLGVGVIENVWARSNLGEQEALSLAHEEMRSSRDT